MNDNPTAATGDYAPASVDVTAVLGAPGGGAGEAAEADQGRRGHFTLLRVHAEGGLGRVSVARDEKLGRNVALKELLDDKAQDAALRQRFTNEAAITGQLEHPGIVPVYALDN